MHRQETPTPVIRALLPAVALAATLLVGPSIAGAETLAADERLGPEEPAEILEPLSETVVVTARKREEEVQEVPMTIAVFTARSIEESGIENVEDLVHLTPNFAFANLFGGGAATPVIRGLSQTIGEPNVGFFLDGVYQTSRAAMEALLDVDVHRVEVLKGPQTTLYGRNTFAGAVNVITATPSNSRRATAMLNAGSHDRISASGLYSGPLVQDRLFLQLGGSHFQRDGYYLNELTGTSLDDRRTSTGAVTLFGLPSLRLTLRGRVAFEQTRDGDNPLQYAENNFHFSPTFNDFQVFHGRVPGVTSGYAVTPGRHDRDNLQGSVTLSLMLGRHLLLTSTTGYNDLTYETEVDSDYSPLDIHRWDNALMQEELSQEIRLSSLSGGRWTWLAGLYYYDLSSLQDWESRYVGEAWFLGGLHTLTRESTENFALFGEVAVDLSARSQLTLGGRWSQEKKSVHAVDTDVLSGAQAAFEASRSWSNLTPSASINFRFSDRHIGYLSVGNAIKAGGFNVVTATGAIAPEERFYDPEKSWHYELGTKSSFHEGRVQLDLAVFHIEWRDHVVRALGSNFSTLNANAARSTSQGAEAALRYRSRRGFDLGLGLGYTDASYDEYTFGALAILDVDPVLDGRRLEFHPKYNGTASLAYTTPQALVGDYRWFARVDGSYRSDMAIVQTDDARVGEQTMVNLSTGLEGDRWRIALWMRNATGDETPLTGVYLPNPAALFELVTGQRTGLPVFQGLITAPEPRTWGVTVRTRW